MNLTLLTYLIYSLITAFIILRVGWMFFKHGAHYLNDIFHPDLETAASLNRLLLIGYYLLNLGYVAVSIAYFEPIETWLQLIEVIAQRTGYIVLLLGGMHYFNMAWVRIIKPYLQEANSINALTRS